ncbi:MAG: hypothetical protein ABI134_09355, partial [Byssovorax sp.]
EVEAEAEADISEPSPALPEPALEASTLALPAAALIASPEATAEAPPPPSRREAPAQNRLRLARVVLSAGFFGDAVRAAYEALSAAVAGLAEGARPEHHAALVVILYRDLLPSGKVPFAVPATLARLHDLSTLEQLGVPVDPALAKEAVEEAEGLVSQIAG